jgi:hypothetical protein
MPGWGDDINLVRYLRVVVDFILQARQKVRGTMLQLYYLCCYFLGPFHMWSAWKISIARLWLLACTLL